jgi:ABC-type transporter Mla subunit MlaD
LKQSLAGIEQVSRTLAANNDRLVQILANAERASAQVQPLLQSSGDAVQSLRTQVLPQARDTLRQLDGLSAAMNERMTTILQNTEQASTRMGPLLQSSNDAVRALQMQILPEAQRTLTRLDRLSTSLGQSADRIQRNPSLLLRGSVATPVGPGEAP